MNLLGYTYRVMAIPFIHGDISTIVQSIGYVGIFLIIFIESSLFFGFFLPGASLLFTAGILASQGLFNVWTLTILLSIAAVLGDSIGYWFGTVAGAALFSREDSRFFKKSHLEQTEIFYTKHGPKAIVLGRFVPIVRTFVPILAGVGTMKYSTFFRYNMVGGILWVGGVTWLGYALGSKIPNAEQYLTPIVLVIIFITIIIRLV